MKVAVVGAGLAGLTIARLLASRGAVVQVFDAGSRPGGRIRTVAGEEWGGEWIDADHRRAISLCAELGLTLARDEPDYLLDYDGRRAPRRAPWPAAAEDLERFEDSAFAAARAICDRTPEQADRSVADFVGEVCHSAVGRWLATAITRSDEGEDLERVSLHGWLGDLRLYMDREEGDASAFRLAEGMQALADRLWSGAVRKGARLVSCVERAAGLELVFADGATEHADALALAVPAHAARTIEFEPPLTASQLDALAAIGMTRTVKTVLRFDRDWWRAEGWAGYLLTNRCIQQVWPEPFADDPTLCVYTCGADAASLAESDDPVRAALRGLADLFPAAADRFAGGAFIDWIGTPGIAGGFSLVPPGSARSLTKLPRRHGRVFFAGEHLATWRGFLEGALESAEEAAAAMMTV